MLDRVCVVGSSGVVRWSKEWAPADGGDDIVGELICRVLLEERAAAYGGGGGGVGLYSDGKATVRWVVLNEANLLVAAVHQASLVLPYVEALLRETAGAFAARQQALPPEAHDGLFPCDAFSPAFDALVAAAEERAAGEKRAARKQRTFAESKKHEAAPRGVAACEPRLFTGSRCEQVRGDAQGAARGGARSPARRRRGGGARRRSDAGCGGGRGV